MIELRKVSVEYGPRTVLRDVDLAVADGEMVLVAGRTGVGKSTLLGTFNGLVPAFTGGRLTGDVLVSSKAGQVKSTKLVVDVRRKTSVFSGGKAGGRVTGVFSSQ